MVQHKNIHQKINNLANLLQLLSAIIETEIEMRCQERTQYDIDLETQFFHHQVKQHLSRQGVQTEDVNLAMDFINQYIKDR
ncbi:hypothetical protein [Shewanella japonica]|uniref:Uncharacterized protein n=1 Tax=Shewanella japonica TaxID=93973 RepID=A0ABM6JP08_9GAMM|nr:hypothetical protein [Shewanella japonica]ARD23584.1 hypothetical protein SJ2017_3324 [Shewanella japonica]